MKKPKYLLPLAGLLVLVLIITVYRNHFSGLTIPDEVPADTLSEEAYLPPAPAKVYGLVKDSFQIEREHVHNAQNLASILLKYNIEYSTIYHLAQAAEKVFDVRSIKAGNPYSIFLKKDSISSPAWFVYEIDHTDYVVMSLQGDTVVYRDSKPVETIRKSARGVITSSLWNTINDQHLNPNLAIELSEIYAWTVDFFGIEKGDHFSVIYDEQYVDSTAIGINAVYAACFNHRGTPYYAFRYEQDSVLSFFDEQGKSLRKAFLKAPLKFSRISSRFSNNRLHPILKIRRPHHGVDYAAPSGTPVYALGDGRIIHRGWDPKGGGNYIKIKHNSVYTTEYMHLKGFAKGITTGKHVAQGELIGFVGQTGMATGPHLDFRVFKNNTPVDPLKIKAPPVKPIKESQMADYIQYIKTWEKEIKNIEHGREMAANQDQPILSGTRDAEAPVE